MPDGGEDSLASVAVAAVAELDSFELTGRGAGGNQRSSGGARGEQDLDLDGWVAARVENLAAGDEFDRAHAVRSSYRPQWPS